MVRRFEHVLRLFDAKVRYIPNLAAYDAFLQGQYWLARITPESLTKSQACFEKAIALDGSYAMAHVGAATALLLRATYEMEPAHEAMPQARSGRGQSP